MSWVSWQEPDKNRGGKISRWIYCHQFQKHRHTYQFNQRDTSVNLHHLQRMKEWCLPAWYWSSVWLSSSGSYSIHELHPTDQTEIFHTKTLYIHTICFILVCFIQPGLIKYVPLYTFCATPFYVPYCALCRIFKDKCPLSGTKTQVKYVNTGTFLLRRYRYILLWFYYVATETYRGSSEFNICP